MSLRLFSKGTDPRGQIIVSTTLRDTVSITAHGKKFVDCSLEIAMKDFFATVEYVMRNTDLRRSDPRFRFIKCIKSMKKITGLDGKTGKRFRPTFSFAYRNKKKK